MKKKIRLSESILKSIIKESVYRYLNEQEEDDYSEFGLEPSPEEKERQNRDSWDLIDYGYNFTKSPEEIEDEKDIEFSPIRNKSQYPYPYYDEGESTMRTLAYLENHPNKDIEYADGYPYDVLVRDHFHGKNLEGDQTNWDKKTRWNTDPRGYAAQWYIDDEEGNNLNESIKKTLRRVLKEQQEEYKPMTFETFERLLAKDVLNLYYGDKLRFLTNKMILIFTKKYLFVKYQDTFVKLIRKEYETEEEKNTLINDKIKYAKQLYDMYMNIVVPDVKVKVRDPNRLTESQPKYSIGPHITWSNDGTMRVFLGGKYAGHIEQNENGELIGYIPYIDMDSDGIQKFNGTDINQIKQEMENFIKQNEYSVYAACN